MYVAILTEEIQSTLKTDRLLYCPIFWGRLSVAQLGLGSGSGGGGALLFAEVHVPSTGPRDR
jgi:hypothetical protein